MVNLNDPADLTTFESMLQQVLSELPPEQQELLNHAHDARKAGGDMTSHSLELVLGAAVSTVKRENKERGIDPRKGLQPGVYGVDFEMRVVGTVKVGADYDQRISAKADPWGLLALALSKLNGVTVEALVREHLETEKDRTEVTAAVKASASRAIERLKEATVTRCSGKVTSNLGVYLRH